MGNSVNRYRFFALQSLMIGGFRSLWMMKNKTEQWEICGRGGSHFGKRQVQISNTTHDWRDNSDCAGVCACSMVITHLNVRLAFMWFMKLGDDLASKALQGVPGPDPSPGPSPILPSHVYATRFPPKTALKEQDFVFPSRAAPACPPPNAPKPVTV